MCQIVRELEWQKTTIMEMMYKGQDAASTRGTNNPRKFSFFVSIDWL
jgi:hypothetical protein